MANVLITGCSSGFGLLAALEFARRGDNVFATMRNVSKAGPLNEAAAAEGLKVNVVVLDVTDDASVRSAVDSVVADAGTIEILVNNAGIELVGAMHLVSDEEALWQLDTNVLGPLRTMRAVVPVMLQQGGGTIVNVSSVAGIAAVPYTGMYAASKHALEAMTEVMVYELGHRGIRMALIEPGQFATEFGGNARHAEAMAADSEAEDRRLNGSASRWAVCSRPTVLRPTRRPSRSRSSTQRTPAPRSCGCPSVPTRSSSSGRTRAWTSRASSRRCAKSSTGTTETLRRLERWEQGRSGRLRSPAYREVAQLG